MARLLKMAKVQAIRGLHERHWTNRRIARELGVDRETVAKYVRAGPCAPKPAKAPIGSEPLSGTADSAQSSHGCLPRRTGGKRGRAARRAILQVQRRLSVRSRGRHQRT